MFLITIKMVICKVEKDNENEKCPEFYKGKVVKLKTIKDDLVKSV